MHSLTHSLTHSPFAAVFRLLDGGTDPGLSFGPGFGFHRRGAGAGLLYLGKPEPFLRFKDILVAPHRNRARPTEGRGGGGRINTKTVTVLSTVGCMLIKKYRP